MIGATPLDRLPPTVTDKELLALLGSVLANNPTPQATAMLRLRSFQPGFSWQQLVDLAVEHEVLPPLVFALNHRSLLPPVPAKLGEEARAAHVTSRLAVAYGEHLERQVDLRDQLVAALVALNAEGIVPVLIKGAVHLTLQSEWHTARAMRDIDMLVRAEEAERANRILLALGYRADPNPPPLDRHLPELHLPHRAGTIELHTEALSFPARYALTTADVFARAEWRSFARATFQVLPLEWHLLHGLLHHQLADRGHARRMLAIKGLWEFSRVGAEIPSDRWSAIITHAEQHKFLGMLSSWSIQASRLFGLEVPEALLCHEPGPETRRRHLQTRARAIPAETGPVRCRQAHFRLCPRDTRAPLSRERRRCGRASPYWVSVAPPQPDGAAVARALIIAPVRRSSSRQPWRRRARP